MSTCDRSDLQTLGSQLVMYENLPDHWSGENLAKIDGDPSVSEPHRLFLKLDRAHL